MATTPNEEQKIAIEHQGGVLLSAGAGSGKTFVLKEHLIYLCRVWISEYKKNPVLSFSNYIKGKLRSVVMMTFTNKAAGELEIRIRREFNDVLKSDLEVDELELWKTIINHLDYLSVGTIHGFCLKLIRQNFFPGISADQTIVSYSEFHKCLSDLFDDWLVLNEERADDIEFQILLKNKSKVLDALLKVFSDASLRKLWGDSEYEHINIAHIDTDVQILFEALGFDLIWKNTISLSELSAWEGKKWCDFLIETIRSMNSLTISLENVTHINDYFKSLSFKIPPKPSAKDIPFHVKEYYNSVKELKDYLKKNGESFEFFFREKEGKVKKWYHLLNELFQYVEKNYHKLNGITFSDLEYLIVRALENKSIAKRIAEEYKYFIIDEFQDTSYVQFEIVETLIEKDYKRLFCVGDPKQAIYGFRGGEIGVFMNCQKNIPQNLSLKNNYRSTFNVINYNNQLFDFLFQKGVAFQGVEKNAIPVEHQTYPNTKVDDGNVIELCCDISFFDESKKLSNLEIDLLESKILLSKILDLKNEGEKCAILYKRLRPSILLIDLLIQSNTGFTAQVKIPFLEDPINGMFYELISHLRDSGDNSKDYLIYVLNAYLNLINAKYATKLNLDDIHIFEKDMNYYGLSYGVLNFFNRCGVYNSNYAENLSSLLSMIKNSNSNIDELLLILEEQKENSYSMDFQFGDNPRQIIIMTAHAAKGLQFENVFLGGIYTNDVNIPNSGPIGSYPFSFKWSHSIDGKRMFKTPSFLLEELEKKKKEFSESKRLFYVANTRAEKSLYYVGLNFSKVKRIKSQNGSWQRGIELFQEYQPNLIQVENIRIDESSILNSFSQKHMKIPFFHIDDLGVSLQENKDAINVLPELSVTRLVSLAQCPRKFYLENICKLSDEDLEGIPIAQNFQLEIFEMNESGITSDKERGSRLHLELSRLIERNFKIDYSTDLNWTVGKLRERVDNFQMISEKQIKFKLFNYMVSGIPDLVLLPKAQGKDFEIWDFKTGYYSEDKIDEYHFQLYCYAYAYFILDKVKKDQQIKLLICFIDENKLIEKKVFFEDVEKYLRLILENINSPSEKNLNHCSKCQYNFICQK